MPQVILELEISEATAVLGDVDGDGAVTAADVSFLTDAVQNGQTASLDEAAADVDRDGSITGADVSSLAELIAA